MVEDICFLNGIPLKGFKAAPSQWLVRQRNDSLLLMWQLGAQEEDHTSSLACQHLVLFLLAICIVFTLGMVYSCYMFCYTCKSTSSWILQYTVTTSLD
jgi:hypothetical protein